MTKRISYISILKIVSLFCVIFLHIISKTWDSIFYTNLNNFKVITLLISLCRFCVPVFFMCSGVLFLNKKCDIKTMLLKYTLKIYIVFIIFNFIYLTLNNYLIHNLSINIIFNDLIDSILLKNPIFHLWYLIPCIICYLITPILKIFTNKNNIFIDILVLVVLLIVFELFQSINIIPNVWYSRFILYYYLGFFINKYFNKYTLILLFIGSIYYLYQININTVNLSISLNIPTQIYINYMYIGVLIYSAFIFNLFKTIFKREESKFINLLVKHNFVIYLIHGFVIGVISVIIDLKTINIFLSICLTTMTYILSFIISLIYSKLKRRIKHEA